MSYYHAFGVVEQTLTSYCKLCVQRAWGPYFKIWLDIDAAFEFSNGYQSKFRNQFPNYITPEIEGTLWLAGKHIQLALKAFLAYKADASLEEVIDFTEKFVTEQLQDFCNWCGELPDAVEAQLGDEAFEGPA